MANYTYDESGVTFHFYALTILALILVPSTIYTIRETFFSDSKQKNKASTLKLCAQKVENRSKWTSIKYLLVALGWISFVMIGTHLKNSDYSVPNQWDPYAVLGIDSGADVAQIKRAFKKLSLKFHPDKIRDINKEEAELKYIEITRAHKTLTDDEARENFEKYGNPDGLLTRTMGIALPKILVEARTSPFLMILYGIVVGFLLPYYVGSWWYNSSRFTKDRILNPTMITFFKNIREPISLTNLVDLLSAASEFNSDGLAYTDDQESALNELEAKVDLACKEFGHHSFLRSEKFHSKSSLKAKILLYAHFYRVQVDNPKLLIQQQEIVEKSIHLVQKGLIQISSSQGWTGCTIHLVHILQMLVQGVHAHAAPLVQLPYMDYSIYKHIASKYGLYGVHQARKLDSKAKSEAFALLNDKTDTVIRVLESTPQIQITRSILSVIGDSVITPFAIVTLLVKVKIVNPSAHTAVVDSNFKQASEMFSLVDDQDPSAIESLYGAVSKIKKTQVQAPEATAPHLSAKKLSSWWFILSNPLNSKNVVPPILITDLATEKIISVQFQAPNTPGMCDFQINILSDSYIGLDISQNIKMEVSDPNLLPLEPEIEDDISEPEANSLAAQLAEARNQSGNAGANRNNDSSDEE